MAQVRIWVHLVWGTYQRNPVMNSKMQRVELFKHMKSYAREKKIYLDFINGESDHVHALVSLGCDQNIAQVAMMLKGESANYANDNKIFVQKLNWAVDYYAVSVSQSHVVAVRNYIRDQEIHHQKQSFSEECEVFMSKFGFIRMLG